MFVPFRAKEDAETLDGIIRGDKAETESTLHLTLCTQPRRLFLFPSPEWDAQWHKDGTGMMATKYVVSIRFL